VTSKSTPVTSRLTKEEVTANKRQERRYRNLKMTEPNPCWHCLAVFPTPADLLSHVRSTHCPTGNEILCPNCARVLLAGRLTELHKSRCQKLRPQGKTMAYPCPHAPSCKSVFALKQCLWAHARHVHGDGGYQLLECPYKTKESAGCSYTTHSPYILKGHIKARHERTGPVTCEICGKPSPTEVSLKRHIEFTHSEGAEAKYHHYLEMCRVRNRKKYLQELEARKRKEEAAGGPPPLKDSVCKDCGVNCLTPLALMSHCKEFHGVTEDFVCEQCGKGITRKFCVDSRLLLLLLCQNTRLFEIFTDIGFGFILYIGFATLQKVRAHVDYAHEARRDFVCEECGKAYKTGSDLRVSAHIIHDVFIAGILNFIA
jgi:hypothetical protein